MYIIGCMIIRKCNGQFDKGSKPIAGFKKGVFGSKSYRWKGGRPKCPVCKKELSYYAKFCRKHLPMSAERLAAIRLGRKKLLGNKHPMWRGKEAGYRAIHLWVQKHFGKPTVCEKCHKNGVGHEMHWANLNHQYQRIRSHWMALCPKCHGEFDSSAKKI